MQAKVLFGLITRTFQQSSIHASQMLLKPLGKKSEWYKAFVAMLLIFITLWFMLSGTKRSTFGIVVNCIQYNFTFSKQTIR